MAIVEPARGRTRKVKGAIAPSQPSGVYLQTATQIFRTLRAPSAASGIVVLYVYQS